VPAEAIDESIRLYIIDRMAANFGRGGVRCSKCGVPASRPPDPLLPMKRGNILDVSAFASLKLVVVWPPDLPSGFPQTLSPIPCILR
jgi:hypothetical protein